MSKRVTTTIQMRLLLVVITATLNYSEYVVQYDIERAFINFMFIGYSPNFYGNARFSTCLQNYKTVSTHTKSAEFFHTEKYMISAISWGGILSYGKKFNIRNIVS